MSIKTELRLKLTENEMRGLTVISKMSLRELENIAVEPGDLACLRDAVCEVEWALAKNASATEINQLKD